MRIPKMGGRSRESKKGGRQELDENGQGACGSNKTGPQEQAIATVKFPGGVLSKTLSFKENYGE